MAERLIVEPPSDIRDLALMFRYNAPFETPDALKPKGPITRSFNFITGKLDQINWKSRSRRNARAYLQPHPAALRALPRRGPPIYLRLLPPSRRQLEQAQLDKKAHIAAKLNLSPA